MNILFISHDSAFSGAPLALEYVIKKLKTSMDGFSGEVLLIKDGPMRARFNQICPTKVLDKRESSFHKVLRKMHLCGEYDPDCIKLFPGVKPDFVYANTIVSLPTAIAIKQKYGIPVVCHCHEPRLLLDTFNKSQELIDACDRFIAVSRLCAKGLMDKYNVSADKIVFQHPFSQWVESVVDRGVIPDKAVIPNIDDDDFVIGISGATYWLKADDLIPLIVREFFKKYPFDRCKFVALGMIDSSMDRISHDMKNCKLEEHLIVLGRTDTPMRYYSRFNVLLLPSRQDCFPLVAEENAALKKPVIVFQDATGASEWLDDTCSIHVPYLDLEALVDAIHNLYEKQSECEELGARAYDKLLSMYSIDKEIEPIIELVNYFS